MKQVLLLFVLLLLIVGGVFLAQKYSNQDTFFSSTKNPTATINKHTIKLTVARTAEEKEIGLSKTNSISENEGMIFLFEKPDYYSFWMKDMKFPIDIIYINGEEIVTIEKNVQPPTKGKSPTIYTSTKPSDKVLEIQAGLSEKYNLKKGDRIKYENLGN